MTHPVRKPASSYPTYCGHCHYWDCFYSDSETGISVGMCGDGGGVREDDTFACVKGILMSVVKDIERENQD